MSMLRRVLIVTAALVAAFAMAAPASAAISTASAAPALASPATAYPQCEDAQIALKLSSATVVGGSNLTLVADGFSGTVRPAGTMTIQAFSKTHNVHDNSTSWTIKTPVVKHTTTFRINARFVPDSLCGSGSVSSAAVSTAAQGMYRAAETSAVVTLTSAATTPSHNSAAGFLPNTGGVSWWILVIGAALLVAGGAIVLTVRRGKSVV